MRTIIRKAAPQATEKISYAMPTFYLHGNQVHFAAYKHHIGLYPTPTGLEAFKNEISRYKHSKGTVQFPLDKPLPVKLIAKVVEYRVKENSEKAKANSKGTHK
jgi:uncharacterized protein YdhG (YjbR/CyaY superfamily)